MNKNRAHSGVSTFFMLLAIAPCALGDGLCSQGEHTVTAVERLQMTSILKTAQSALPLAPEGWILVVDPSLEFSIPHTICGDVAKAPWRYELARTYRRSAGADARQNIYADLAARQRAAMQARQPRLDAAQAKAQKIIEQQMALNQKGDYAGAEKLQPQLEAAQKEYQGLIQEANDPAAIAAANRQVEKDREFFINVRVNPGSEKAGPSAKAVPLPAGGRVAQRWYVEDENQSNDNALFLFGAWQPGAAGGWQRMSRTGIAPSGAHGVAVYMRGDAQRVTEMVEKIDFAKLAAASSTSK